ncbi:MAG: ferredoxin family protein [Lentisphaerae bacterium]|nr:ferredoxin family protein [Lentisphaerota bacterium]
MADRFLIYCHCAYKQVIPEETRSAVWRAVSGADSGIVAVADLCELAALRSDILKPVAECRELVIAACYPRAVRWLLNWAGYGLEGVNLRVLNMRTLPPSEVLAGFGMEPRVGEDGPPPPKGEGKWVPWFPVIDYDRCKNCKQCIAFCPFSVYGLSADRKVEVQRPEACKDNCPACARMCPEVAIMFPKVQDTPINGERVDDEEVTRRRKDAFSEQLKKGGDIHSLLAARRARAGGKRFTRPAEASAEGSQGNGDK